MVNVSSKNNEISINISTAGNKSNIKLGTPQNYYENLAKHWAVSEKLVNGEDYSSKHYANESKLQAILAKEKADIAVIKAQEILDNGDEALSNIATQEDISRNAIITEGESQITNIQASGNDALNNLSKCNKRGRRYTSRKIKRHKCELCNKSRSQVHCRYRHFN